MICHFCGDDEPGRSLWSRNNMNLCIECQAMLLASLLPERDNSYEQYCSYCRRPSHKVVAQAKTGTTICVDCLEKAVAMAKNHGLFQDRVLSSTPPTKAMKPFDRSDLTSPAMTKALEHIDALWRTILRERWGLDDNGQPTPTNLLHIRYFPQWSAIRFRRQLRQQEALVFKELRSNQRK